MRIPRPAVITLLCLTFTTAAAAPALAGGSAQAPVIHESFTLLPCPSHPGTTIALEGCAEHKVVALDAKINRLNAAIFGHLSSAKAKQQFVHSHIAWLAFRTADCTSVSDAEGQGSDSPVIFANCLAEINAQRVDELSLLHKSLTTS